jgi:tryptophan synthase beta chain
MSTAQRPKDRRPLPHGGAARRDRITLSANEVPRAWYNVLADLPFPLSPPLSPATGKPVSPDELLRIFPPQLLEQEMSTERFIPIPESVLEVLAMYRPTPLIRARRLEQALDTSARIYYKHEGVSPAGSHKPNTAIPQAYYNKIHGVKRLATETGAGQWGSALAFATHVFGMSCRVYMVRVSHDQKPYRRTFMRLFGAEVVPSPSPLTASGRAVLAADPGSPGSLGIAISEAVEEAATRSDTNYALGSVLNHVLLHQTVIGLEAQRQLALVDDYPDYVIGCHGGGSNFGGIALPFVRDAIAGRKVRAIAVEPASCPTLTRGRFAYDFGDTAGLAPIVRMYTLGHGFVPPATHAGGLRYHGASPLVSGLLEQGIIDAEALGQAETFEAALLFAHTEGIVPAPESAHAVAGAIRKAREVTEQGRKATILFSLSGHGLFDLAAYDAFLDGTLEDTLPPDGAIAAALDDLPQVGG